MTPHNRPTLGSEEQIAAERVIASGWVAQGSEVESFENELCDFFKIPYGHALVVSSGSAALYLALWVLEGQKKRIGLPVYSCNALRNAIGLINGKPVYLDCSKDGPNIDISDVGIDEIDILIAPSMFGIPVDIPSKRNFKVIEDMAQSMGASVGGKRIGLRGEIGICSFYATKMMTSGGQGGAILSHDKSLIDGLRDYRQFDCRGDRVLRFNFQLTDLQAAIGREQLKKMPDFLSQRENIFNAYHDAGLSLLGNLLIDKKSSYYRAVMRSTDPEGLIHKLAKSGVIAIVPINEYELLDTPSLYPAAQHLCRSTLSLPCYPLLPTEDAHSIARTIKEFI